MSILDKIVTPNFVAWNAHMFFAAFVVSTALWYLPPATVISAALAAAAIKEFYIDKHFEEGQSFLKNLRDFAGYAAGAAIGWFVQSQQQSQVLELIVSVLNVMIAQVCRPVAVT